jgi:hypothetical protein
MPARRQPLIQTELVANANQRGMERRAKIGNSPAQQFVEFLLVDSHSYCPRRKRWPDRKGTSTRPCEIVSPRKRERNRSGRFETNSSGLRANNVFAAAPSKTLPESAAPTRMNVLRATLRSVHMPHPRTIRESPTRFVAILASRAATVVSIARPSVALRFRNPFGRNVRTFAQHRLTLFAQ